MTHMYESPLYYEIAFSGRNIRAETEFMAKLAAPGAHFLEIASGNSPHMRELLDRGYRYTGVELSPEMIDFSREKLGTGDRVTLLQGDLRNFDVPEPCDFAFLMVCSLFVGDNAELDSHFDAVARALRPGGLYLLDGCVHFRLPDGVLDWTMSRRGVRVHATVTWKFQWVQQAFAEHVVLDVDDRGRPSRHEHRSVRRALFPQEFKQYIARRPDFEFVGWWNDFDLGKPIEEGQDVLRPIVVVRRV